MRALAVVFVCLFLWVSCSATKSEKSVSDSHSLKTKIRVENRNISRMTIYILRRSERVRLGSVDSHLTETFVIPERFVGGATPLRLMADPVGTSKNPVSEEFDVRRGDVIEMIIRAF